MGCGVMLPDPTKLLIFFVVNKNYMAAMPDEPLKMIIFGVTKMSTPV